MQMLNWVHLHALMRKNWLQMTAHPWYSLLEVAFLAFQGTMLGYEVSSTFKNNGNPLPFKFDFG